MVLIRLQSLLLLSPSVTVPRGVQGFTCNIFYLLPVKGRILTAGRRILKNPQKRHVPRIRCASKRYLQDPSQQTEYKGRATSRFGFQNASRHAPIRSLLLELKSSCKFSSSCNPTDQAVKPRMIPFLQDHPIIIYRHPQRIATLFASRCGAVSHNGAEDHSWGIHLRSKRQRNTSAAPLGLVHNYIGRVPGVTSPAGIPPRAIFRRPFGAKRGNNVFSPNGAQMITGAAEAFRRFGRNEAFGFVLNID